MLLIVSRTIERPSLVDDIYMGTGEYQCCDWYTSENSLPSHDVRMTCGVLYNHAGLARLPSFQRLNPSNRPEGMH